MAFRTASSTARFLTQLLWHTRSFVFHPCPMLFGPTPRPCVLGQRISLLPSNQHRGAPLPSLNQTEHYPVPMRTSPFRTVHHMPSIHTRLVGRSRACVLDRGLREAVECSFSTFCVRAGKCTESASAAPVHFARTCTEYSSTSSQKLLGLIN